MAGITGTCVIVTDARIAVKCHVLPLIPAQLCIVVDRYADITGRAEMTLFAVQLCRLGDEEKTRELQEADPDKFVAFQFREQVRAGNHSKPLTFAQLASKWPGALIVCLLLVAMPAQGQIIVRDSTGRMSVVQVFAPAPQPVEKPRPSPFDRYWAEYGRPVAPRIIQGASTPPAPATQAWLINPFCR